MKLSDFDYYLPKNQVAQYPLTERDSARLLVLHRGEYKIEHRIFSELIEYLRAGDVLVLNDTKVIPARLYGKKPSGGKVEVLLVKELYPDKWEVFVNGLKHGTVIFPDGVSGDVSRHNGTAALTITHGSIKEALSKIGVMPLPPYIKRPASQLDSQWYQTVYAEKEGAIASPTAGLHFTRRLLNAIREKCIEVQKLTLHVGCGTFKPVVSDDIRGHQMDEEFYEIPDSTAEAVTRAKSEGRKVIAVGTTVTRALEASALPCPIPPLTKGGEGGFIHNIKAGVGKASIFIYPGYKFRVIDALITNFHLPRSTTMMLTSAFAGLETLKKVYAECSKAEYRFFSYGDAMLIV